MGGPHDERYRGIEWQDVMTCMYVLKAWRSQSKYLNYCVADAWYPTGYLGT